MCRDCIHARKPVIYNSELNSNNLGGAFLYSSLMKNLPGLIGIPIAPAIQQEIGLVWKKGKYVNDSVEKYIAIVQKK